MKGLSYTCLHSPPRVSQVVLAVKNLSVNAGDTEDTGLIPGSGRSPRQGNDNLFQYSCLEKSHEQRSLEAYIQSMGLQIIRCDGATKDNSPPNSAPIQAAA